MNDLPQNELFSAYLDGELNAAEQAEVERLLAASPAARRLLDDLRALSATLQSLPQEKLGEDLSPQVLRVAERRMLTEGEPSTSEQSPMPLVRTALKRFLNRRALVWAGLAVAVAVMISLTERRPANQLGFDAVKEVAVAKREVRAKEPDQAPSIHAVEPRGSESDMEAEDSSKKSLLELTTDQDVARSSVPMPSEDAKPNHLAKAAAPKTESDARTPSKRSVVSKEGAVAAADSAQPVPEEAEVDQNVLVVNCDISRDAAKKQTFDKLLLANGIALQSPVIEEDKFAERTKKDVSKSVNEPADEAAAEAGGVDLVLIEATLAQVEATLAGLTAQPSAFPSVSVEPTQNLAYQSPSPPGTARAESGPSAGGYGNTSGQPMLNDSPQRAVLRRDEGEAAPEGDVQSQVALPSASQGWAQRFRQPAELPENAKAALESEGVNQLARSRADLRSNVNVVQQQLATQRQANQLRQSSARQQVLFILNVVDAKTPAAAAPAAKQ